MTNHQEWSAASLLQLSGGYWQICTLHAAVRLDVFSVIGNDQITAEALATQLACNPRALTMLLNALSAMGLLRQKQGHYALLDAAARFLVRSSDDYIGHMILHHHHLVPSWAFLHEAVRGGGPLRKRATDDAGDQQREAFLMGMFNIASMQAPALVKQIDLSTRRRLLDFGGGPGTYAIHFCRQYPELTADLFDLPTTRPFAEKTIARFGLADRVRFVAGDYHKDSLPERYDVVWLSQILHAEGPEACRKIMSKAAGALVPGGSLFIHEFILEDTLDRPLAPALFALNMLLGTPDGQSYSESQLCDMMQQAGIGAIQRHHYCGPMQSGILEGVKEQA